MSEKGAISSDLVTVKFFRSDNVSMDLYVKTLRTELQYA